MQNAKLQFKIQNLFFVLVFITLLNPISYLYAQDEINEVLISPSLTINPPLEPDALLWVEDTIPEEANTTGEWGWDEQIKFSGMTSHTDGAKKGIHSHSFKVPSAVGLTRKSVIWQHVYLNPKSPPKGIMLKLIISDDKAIVLYWEAEEEVFVDTVEYMEAWYMGFLPKQGNWQKLVINIKELEIAPVEIIGISFITFDGQSYWDRTVVNRFN